MTQEIYGHKYTAPLDLVSGGTWIYYTENFIVCILNGAYEKHKHQPPYRMSRGLIILEVIKYDAFDEFMLDVDLEGIEPFTIIMVHRFTNERKVLVWDGQNKFQEDHSGENLIVRSSSTLYNEEEKNYHRGEFEKLKEITPQTIFELQNRLKMEPNDRFPTVQTTSITQIIQDQKEISLQFCPIVF